MRYVNLGRSGLQVSELGLGTAQFGLSVDAERANEIVSAFAHIGGTFIDTANVYGRDTSTPGGALGGIAEEYLGRALRGRRDQFVVATKGYWLVEPELGPNRVGLSRTYLIRNVEASLRRLDTDYLDLFQCHVWDPYTPLEETIGVLGDMVRAGKIRYIGVSNWQGWHLATAAALTTRSSPIVSNQVLLNLADQSARWSIIPACRYHDVSVIAWGVLAQGFLSGHFHRESIRPAPPHPLAVNHPWESSNWERLACDRNWNMLDLLRSAAEATSGDVASVATRWVLDSNMADVALVGWTETTEIERTREVLLESLPTGVVDALSHASSTVPPYPNYFYELYANRDEPGYGGDRTMLPAEPTPEERRE